MNSPFTRVVLAAALFLIPFRTMTPQQAAQSQRFPQFENEEVSVWKTIVTPNAPLTMHTHQHPRVIIALSGGTMKVVNEDGTSEMHPWETGKAYWLPASEGLKRHADQNQGTKPIEVMVVELKKAH
jgi:beta-alanine degradation protein BauB